MSRRDNYGQYAKKRSPAFIISTWIASFLSLGLLYLAGNAVVADLAGFRSCNANNSGLVVVSCGKQAFGMNDIILIGLLMLTAALVVTLFTAAWRLVRRSK